MEIDKIKKEDLKYFGYREEPYFASDIMIGGWYDIPRMSKIFGLKQGVRWLQINYNLFEIKKDHILLEKNLSKIFKNKGISFITHLNKECIKASKRLIQFSKKISKKVLDNKINNEELIILLKDYSEHLSAYTVFMLLAAFEKPTMEIVETLIKKRKDNTGDLLGLITTPEKQTTVEKEQEDFLKIAVSNIKDKSILIKKHAEKYGWLAIRYFLGNTWTANDVKSRLKSINREEARKKLDKKILTEKLLEKKISLAIKKFSKKEKELVKMVRKIVYLRNQRMDFLSESVYYVRPFLLKITLSLDVSYEELLNLCTEEIILSLKGSFDYKKLIKDREHGFVIFHKPKEKIVYSGKKFDSYIKKRKFLLLETSIVDEIKGVSGFKGKVQGIVTIVKSENDLKKVKKNNILVAPMTLPHFISAMEKASAFVTDEGGITCHAAIVAREMKKPCIIGTKIATKVLHDGDLVEVDANKGVVRIIKKAK